MRRRHPLPRAGRESRGRRRGVGAKPVAAGPRSVVPRAVGAARGPGRRAGQADRIAGAGSRAVRTISRHPGGISIGPVYASRSSGKTRRPARESSGPGTSYYGHMKEIGAREAKNSFGLLLDAAQKAPVRVTKHGRPVGIVMSIEQYARLRGAAWEALAETMDRLSAEAAARGLTDEKLDELLADES